MTASAQWATRPADQRFQTLSALREAVHSRRLRSRSVDLDLGRIVVKPQGTTLEVNSAIAPCEPSHWALGQLSGIVGAPGNYIRSLSPQLASDNLNYGISRRVAERPDVKFMTVTNPGGGNATLQAVTSTTYGRIWDADAVDAVGRIVERSGGKFHNPMAYKIDTQKGNGFAGITGEKEPSGLFASDRDVFMFMIDGGSLLEAGPRCQLNRGFIVWNSEVGAKVLGLMTFCFNAVCGNLIIWGASDVNTLLIRHSRNAPTRFDTEAYPALVEFSERGQNAELETIKRAQRKMLPEKADDVFAMVQQFRITRAEMEEAVSYAEREEGQCASLFDLVQGGTAYARGFDYVDARLDVSKRFSNLLKLVGNE